MADVLAALSRNKKRRDDLMIERDELILEAKTTRVPITHIAAALGMSAMQVHRIINDAWIVVDASTLEPITFKLTEDAAKAVSDQFDGDSYYRQVKLKEGGGWE